MTRKKVKLAFISSDSARKATFKKRKRGLMKKVSELTTLCGIQACVIVYSPYESSPEVWPSPHGVQQVVSQFKKMPEMEQSKKMVNQESFLRQRIGKATDQLKKQRKENREKEVTQVMFQGLIGKSLLSLNVMDLNDLAWLIDQNLKDITNQMETLSKPNTNDSTNTIIVDNNNNNSTSNSTNNNAQGGDVTMAASAAVAVEVLSPVGGGAGEVAEAVMAEPRPFPEADSERPIFEDGAQRQQWFMDMINPQDQIPFGGNPVGVNDELLPFPDQNQSGFWSNDFYP